MTMVYTFSDKAHNTQAWRTFAPKHLSLPSDADAKALAKVTLFQAPLSIHFVFYCMPVIPSWPVLVCHHLLTISRIKFSLPS